MTTHSTIMWAIVGTHGLYTGTWLRRIDAIAEHVHDVRLSDDPYVSRFPVGDAVLSPVQAFIWRRRQRDGDRAVKVTVTWDSSK